MKWNVDFKELIALLGRTIYRPENVLVELCANSYDADATTVEVTTKGDSAQILVRDDGTGMDRDALEELVTIAKSKKREMVDRGERTPVYGRSLLGSFGIGIISFFALGDFIRIFTTKKDGKPLFVEIRKVFDGTSLQEITVSDPQESAEYASHLLSPHQGTTIEVNNNRLDFNKNYDLIKHKLSNLPLSDKFRIHLNELEVKKDDFEASAWLQREFEFVLDSIDPSYRSKCQVYVNSAEYVPTYKRGIFLVVNGRVIEKDLYAALYPELHSPGAIAARVRGFVTADYLHHSIQANREDFFDSDIIAAIKDKVRGPLDQIIEDYTFQRSTEEKEKAYTDLLQRIERAKNKFLSKNDRLKALGLNFVSTPEFEQEVVLIIAQLCQKGILPFQILDYNSGSHIDCIVKWPLEQAGRDPDFISELEVETSLDHFFDHNHDFRTKPDVCCWSLRQADFDRKKAKYMANHPESIVDISLQPATDPEDFGHQNEIHFTVRETHNEQHTFILRVYVIPDIVQAHLAKSL